MADNQVSVDSVFSSEEDSDTSDSQSVCSSVSSVTSDFINDRPPSTGQQKKTQQRNRGRKKGGKRGIIWVGNIPPNATSKELVKHFISFKASICNKPTVLSPKDTTNAPQKSANTQNKYSFIHFTTLEKANEVIQEMNGSNFNGRKLTIHLKDKKKKNKHIATDPSSCVSKGSSVPLTTKAIATRHSSEHYENSNSDNESVCSSVSSSMSTTSDQLSSSQKQSHRNERKRKQKTFSVSVHNLPPDCTAQQISNHFAAYKSNIVNKVNIHSSKTSSSSSQRKFTFLVFNSLDKANEVVEKMNKTTLCQKKLTLKLQEDKTSSKKEKKSTGSESSITGISPRSSALMSVKITNVPHGIDKDDLMGLLKHVHISSCNVSGSMATLNFSTPEDAKKAVDILDKKQLCGVSLNASLTDYQSIEDLVTSSKPSFVASRGSGSQKNTPLFATNHFSSHGYPQSTGGSSVIHPHPMGLPHVLVGPPIHPLPHVGPPILPLPHVGPPIHPMARPVCPPHNMPHSFQPVQQLNTRRSRSSHGKASTKPITMSHIEKRVPAELYAMFCKSSSSKITDFEKTGGSIQYKNGIVSICSPLATEATTVSSLLDTYSQKEFSCSPTQWNSLVMVDKVGKRQMNELTEPFQYNPSVEIIEVPLKLIVVGLKDAVDSAYRHIFKNLNKEIKVDSSKLNVLIQLEPSLPLWMHSLYGVTIKGYTANSSSIELEDVCEESDQIRSLIEDKLAKIYTTSLLAELIPSPLIRCARKLCHNANIPIVITVDKNEIVLSSSSKETLDAAKDILCRKPFVNMIQLSRFSDTCLQYPFADKFEFDYVNVRMADDLKVVLEGLCKDELQAAKSIILKFLNDNFKKEKHSVIEENLIYENEAQLVYLTRLLQSRESDEMLKSLLAKCLLRDGKILINGTKEAIVDTTGRLLEMVPKYSKHIYEVRNANVIERLLKRYILTTIDSFSFIWPGEETGKGKLTVYLFDNDQTTLAQISDTLNAIDPSVLYFSVRPKAKDVVKKVINDIEDQHRCCIDLMKSGTAKITIHGLTQEDRNKTRAAIQDYIDENYIITNTLPSTPITGLQMKYILLKHEEELKELGRPLRSFNYPFQLSKIPAFDIRPNQEACFKVVGISKTIRYLEDAIDTFIDGFTVERFAISLQNFRRYPWRKRWEAIKQEARDSQSSIIEYKLPGFEETNSPILFTIYGNQAENVAQLKERIESEAMAGGADGKLKLSSEQVKQLLIAIKNKQINFDDYMVEVRCVEKNELVFINSLAVTADTVEVVKMEIKGFIECTSDTTEDIKISDVPVFMVFISKKLSYYRETNLIAQKLNVSLRTFRRGTNAGVCLKGSRVSVDTVKERITELIKRVKETMGSLEMTLDPLLESALTPTFISRLEEKLLNDYYVDFRYLPAAPSEKENEELKTVYIQLFSGTSKVKLSIYSGSITKQTTDVIVNSASENLQHDRGLAKLILMKGGPIIQKECNEYIQKHGKVKQGDVMCTSAGNLSCTRVVHAVPPEWQGGHSNEKEIIYTAIFNSLSVSEGYSSISIPALGCCVFNVPTDVCAEMSLKAVRDFFCCHTESSLAEIVFIMFSKETQESFTKCLSDVFPDDSFLSKDDINPLATTHAVWFWKNDNGDFEPYDSKTSQRISYEFQQNPRSMFYLFINELQYAINLQNMTQMNLITSFQREIKMDTASNTVVVASWYWVDDNKKLTPYKSDDSAKIEAMNGSKSISMLTINNQPYIFDYRRMVQINHCTGHKRDIQRKLGYRLQVEKSVYPHKMSKSKPPIKVRLYGLKSNLQVVNTFIKDLLQQMLKEDEIDLPSILSKNFMNKLEQIGIKYKVSCEVQDRPRNAKVLLIKGVKTDLAVRDVQRYIIEQQNQSDDVTNRPPEWCSQINTTELFPIRRGTPEWMTVEGKFKETMSKYPVHEIVRIQNIYLWERWIEEKYRIGKFKGCINDKALFHGSGKTDPQQIYDSEIGFDMRFCTSGMWGQANYFAVNASYSHNYCHTNSNGKREMFLVNVITGDAYNCKSDRSLRMPPLKDNVGRLGLSQVRYDAVTGTTAGSQVYMSYDNQKAYPAYLIRY